MDRWISGWKDWWTWDKVRNKSIFLYFNSVHFLNFSSLCRNSPMWRIHTSVRFPLVASEDTRLRLSSGMSPNAHSFIESRNQKKVSPFQSNPVVWSLHVHLFICTPLNSFQLAGVPFFIDLQTRGTSVFRPPLLSSAPSYERWSVVRVQGKRSAHGLHPGLRRSGHLRHNHQQ